MLWVVSAQRTFTVACIKSLYVGSSKSDFPIFFWGSIGLPTQPLNRQRRPVVIPLFPTSHPPPSLKEELGTSVTEGVDPMIIYGVY